MRLAHPLLLVAVCALTACDPVTLGLMTTGGGLALNHQLSGTVTRTFSEDPGLLHEAVIGALGRMSIEIHQDAHEGEAELIEGVAGSRSVSLRIEPVTRSSTQLSVTVHRDLLTVDAATGREIVAQTEQAMITVVARANAAASLAANSATEPPTGARVESASGKTTYFGKGKPETTYYGRALPETPAPATTRVTMAAAQRARTTGNGSSGSGQ